MVFSMVESIMGVKIKGCKYSVELKSGGNILALGDAGHSFWHKSDKSLILDGDWVGLQDRIIEQIGNGASIICLGWNKEEPSPKLKSGFFDFISYGVKDYPLLLDFKKEEDLERALKAFQGYPLVMMPAVDSSQFHNFALLTGGRAAWLCPLRYRDFVPWQIDERLRLAEFYLKKMREYGLQEPIAFYQPLPTDPAKIKNVFAILESLPGFKEKVDYPLILRPYSQKKIINPGWSQSVLTALSLFNQGDALILNPLQREVAQILKETSGLLNRPLTFLPLEMKRWIKPN